MMGWGWNGQGWSGGGPWDLVSGLLAIVLLAAVVVGGIMIVRWFLANQARDSEISRLAPPVPPSDYQGQALRILEERYARGDIDRQEFLQRKQDLAS